MTSGIAEIFLQDGRKINVLLADVSSGGIGFTARSGNFRSLPLGSEITLKYKNGDNQTQRKARVKNVMGTRAGAEFSDHLAQLMKTI